MAVLLFKYQCSTVTLVSYFTCCSTYPWHKLSRIPIYMSYWYKSGICAYRLWCLCFYMLTLSQIKNNVIYPKQFKNHTKLSWNCIIYFLIFEILHCCTVHWALIRNICKTSPSNNRKVPVGVSYTGSVDAIATKGLCDGIYGNIYQGWTREYTHTRV